MPNLTPESARKQAEKLFGPSEAKLALFEDWYWNDCELEISGPIIEGAIYAAKQKVCVCDEAPIEQAASIAVDAVFIMLGLSTEMVAGLLNGSCKVVKVH